MGHDEILLIAELTYPSGEYIGQASLFDGDDINGACVTMVDMVGQGVADYSSFVILSIDRTDSDLLGLIVRDYLPGIDA